MGGKSKTRKKNLEMVAKKKDGKTTAPKGKIQKRWTPSCKKKKGKLVRVKRGKNQGASSGSKGGISKRGKCVARRSRRELADDPGGA